MVLAAISYRFVEQPVRGFVGQDHGIVGIEHQDRIGRCGDRAAHERERVTDFADKLAHPVDLPRDRACAPAQCHVAGGGHQALGLMVEIARHHRQAAPAPQRIGEPRCKQRRARRDPYPRQRDQQRTCGSNPGNQRQLVLHLLLHRGGRTRGPAPPHAFDGVDHVLAVQAAWRKGDQRDRVHCRRRPRQRKRQAASAASQATIGRTSLVDREHLFSIGAVTIPLRQKQNQKTKSTIRKTLSKILFLQRRYSRTRAC